MIKSKFYIAATLIFTVMTGLALAADKPAAVQQACEGLKIATGPTNKGFSKYFKDINSVCGSKVPVCEVTTEGGLDNLDFLSSNKADIGFTMADAWKRRAENDDKIKDLKQVMTTNQSYLHVLVRTGGHTIVAGKTWYGTKNEAVVRISKFSELKGRPVALVGSTQLMGRRLDDLYKMGWQEGGLIVDVSGETADADAFKLLQAGRVFAVLTISGWPNGKVEKLKTEDGLTLADFDYKVESPYNVKPLSYRNLGLYGTPAVTVQNVLISRPFGGTKAKAVDNLRSCIMANLQDLKDGSYEPGWSEVGKQ